MADYYPLLARALDALPDRSPAMRKAVYDRARGALIAQLRSLDPPIAEADIELERKALDAAIGRLETAYGEPAPPAEAPAAEPPAPPPAPPAAAVPSKPEFLPDPSPAAQASKPAAEEAPKPAAPAPERASEPTLPPAPPPELIPPAAAADALPEAGPPEPFAAFVPPRPPRPEPAPSAAAEGEAPAEPANANGRRRPKIDVVPPRTGRAQMLRNAVVFGLLAIVIGAIGVAAYLLRDKPSPVQEAASSREAPAEPADSKFADRIGGDQAPPPRKSQAPARAPAPTDMTVAQRAVLIEENTADPEGPAKVTQGRVVWRLDTVSGEQSQPLQTVIRANVDYPDAGFGLTMTIRKNTDAALPASHTVEIAFTTSGTDAAKHAVQSIGLIALKDEEKGRGTTVSGLPVRVRDNLFLIGLSSLKSDVDRNTDLLLHRPWFDLGLQYASGGRAILSFEKGNTGTQVIQSAFEQWND